MKWTVNWSEYYDAEGPKIIESNDKIVDPKNLIGKRIVDIRVDDYGEMIFETED